MTPPPREVEFSEDTEIRCGPTNITEEDLQRLEEAGVFVDVGLNEDDGHSTAETVEIDVRLLAELLYRYETLDYIASDVRVEVLHHFRTSDDNKHSTKELQEATGRHKSTVSDALGTLTEAGYLEQIQRGIYALDID